jgi:hypothetical protein
MPLPSRYFLVCIKADIFATDFRRLDALAVNNCRTWFVGFLKPQSDFPA